MTSLDTPPDATERLLREVVALRKENEQLRRALESRIVIEQAKGVLGERFALVPDQAFEAMRRAARNESRKIHEVAREILGTSRTPAAVARYIEHRDGGGAA